MRIYPHHANSMLLHVHELLSTFIHSVLCKLACMQGRATWWLLASLPVGRLDHCRMGKLNYATPQVLPESVNCTKPIDPGTKRLAQPALPTRP
jgi:hypothetical protein